MTIYGAYERILVKRAASMGDVLFTTPIVARLAKENPEALIDVETLHPAPYLRNPHVQCVRPQFDEERYTRVIDLNMAFENKLRRVPIIDAYSEVAFGDWATPKRLQFTHGKAPHWAANWEKTIIIHPAGSWANRSLPREWWQKFADEMWARDWTCIATGTAQDHHLDLPAYDARSQLSLADQAALIERAAVFVSTANGLCELAHTTSTPTVVMVSTQWPGFIEVERNGGMGWGFFPVVADVPCVGCGGELDHPVTFHECRYHTNDCMRTFTPEDIADRAIKAASWGQEQRGRNAA
jgi:ADP-heptose:LPS heptosyltransferase